MFILDALLQNSPRTFFSPASVLASGFSAGPAAPASCFRERWKTSKKWICFVYVLGTSPPKNDKKRRWNIAPVFQHQLCLCPLLWELSLPRPSRFFKIWWGEQYKHGCLFVLFYLLLLYALQCPVRFCRSFEWYLGCIAIYCYIVRWGGFDWFLAPILQKHQKAETQTAPSPANNQKLRCM